MENCPLKMPQETYFPDVYSSELDPATGFHPFLNGRNWKDVFCKFRSDKNN